MTKRFCRIGAASIIVIFLLFFSSKSPAGVAINPRLVTQSLAAIERFYIDPSSVQFRKLLDESLSSVQKAIPEFIARADGAEKLSLTMGLAKRTIQVGKIQNASQLNDAMLKVAEFVSQNYTGELKATEVEAVMIDGMLNALDPHSNFLSKKTYNEFKIGTRGEFGGLGIVITTKDGMLTVISAIEGTPAFAAGIRAGDTIMQIGDESTINMSLTDAVNKLRGKVGTPVSILVERSGKQARKLTLTRAIINIDSVKSALLTEDGKRIGLIAVKSFQSNTLTDVKTALESFHKDGMKLDGMVLDLRNNPGGLLNVAVGLADIFMNEAVVVTTVGQNGEVLEKEMSRTAGTEPLYPLIVLVNEGSASASEIVAGALKENDRAIVMGEESFGKGSVQTVFDMEGDTGLKLTISRYMPAGTLSIQAIGIMPDVEVRAAIVDKAEINLVADKHFSEEDLEKHLEKNADSQRAKPAYDVKFLMPKEKEADEKTQFEAEAKKEYSKTIDLEKDFAGKLAIRLVAKAGRSSRKEMLSSIAPEITKANTEEDKKIDEAMKLLGIDWSKQPAGGKPELALSSRVLVGGQPVAKAVAGQKIELELTAKNVGQGTFSQLLAIGQSETMSFLANREFAFGLIRPGESRKWSVPIELPQGITTQKLLMDVTFEEANSNAPAKTIVSFVVDAAPEPHFTMDYKTTGITQGKPLPVNSPVAFDVNLQNSGSGETSADTIVSISDECDDKVFIEKGRISVGIIKPAASKVANLRFHMLDGYDAANCAINLIAADVKKGVITSKRISISPATGTIIPPAGTKLSPPKIIVDKAPLECDCEKVKISGKITAQDNVRDYYVFAGENKIEYVVNPSESKELVFSVEAPLKEGSNVITVGARDELKITASRAVVVDRLAPKKK